MTIKAMIETAKDYRYSNEMVGISFRSHRADVEELVGDGPCKPGT